MSRTLKVIIIGDGSAGKTSLRSRYLTGSYQKAYISTIGADFISKTLEVKVPIPISSSSSGRKQAAKSTADTQATDQVGEASTSTQPLHTQFQTETIRVTLSIWDTAGQERFKSLGSAFYRGSDAVIVAFDLSKKGSLARTINWYNDFCRLGDVGYEEDRMNNGQLKRAREQKERFCWVGVGCKGDLLEELGRESSTRGTEEADSESEWMGTSWSEARGWFDTMIPRLLPEGEVEKEGYKNKLQEHIGDTAVPYPIGEQVPARPEDVLSRPNKVSSSLKSTDGVGRAESSPGRPAEAGLAPGSAPAPGTRFTHKKSHQRSGSKSKRLREQRKSIRSIEVWQGDSGDTSTLSSSTGTAKSSTTTTSPSVPISNGKDQHFRNRFDSTTSAGGPPSVYYSVRGSTFFGQSPAGASASSPDGSTASSERTTTTTTRDGQHSRGMSLNSQARNRKQSNLSEVLINEDENNDGITGVPSTLTNGSSNTIKGFKMEENLVKGSGEEEDEDIVLDGASIPTIPSGDPIPFPSSDDYEDDEGKNDELELPKRRGKGRKPQTLQDSGTPQEGEVGRKAKAIAEQTQQDITKNEEEQNKLGLHGEPIDPRATLYSARPSSISSTIKAGEDSIASEDEGERNPDLLEDPGLVYRDQMIEQGFRLFFTSAKDGEGIDQVFEHIAKRVAMRWKLEEWEEQKERERGGEVGPGQVRTAPPTDEEVERERVRRAIRISSGKGTGSCCS